MKNETWSKRLKKRKITEKELLEDYLGIKKRRRTYREVMDLRNNYKKSLREIAIELGNCSSCFKPKENVKYRMCGKCREYFRKATSGVRKNKKLTNYELSSIPSTQELSSGSSTNIENTNQ